MTAETKPEPRGIFCVRNQSEKSVSEHLRCPYCFGQKREVIEKGDYAEFCDFDPKKDPTCYGFPESTTRNSRG